MIETLVRLFNTHPELGRDAPPDGLLAPLEENRYRQLKTGKRRRDWLMGRWTAKLLILQAVGRACGEKLPCGEDLRLNEIAILNDEAGVPYACYHQERLPFHLTISHSSDCAFCAISGGNSVYLGVDVEQITPLSGLFAAEYFTRDEIDLLNQGAPSEAHISAIWSAKEAVLKAVGLGLSVDTRSVSCLVSLADEVPGFWAPFAIEWVVDPWAGSLPALAGYWQRCGEYIFTLAAERSILLDSFPVSLYDGVRSYQFAQVEPNRREYALRNSEGAG
jgi:4'-phosphopantetheinyl transferase